MTNCGLSPASGSVGAGSMPLAVSRVSSCTLAVAEATLGASLTPMTVMVRVLETEAPWLSATV